MDKVLKRITKGRAIIAVAMAVCLMLVAAPSLAFAATTLVGSPTGTLLLGPPTIGARVTSTDPALNQSTAVLTVDGVSYANPQITALGAITGSWTYSETLTNGMYIGHWTWSASAGGAGVGAMYAWASPAAKANGTHNATATINGASTSWSYTVAIPATTRFTSVLPGNGTNTSNATPTFVMGVSPDVTSVQLSINSGAPITLTPVAGVASYTPALALPSPSSVTASATAYGTGTAQTVWGFTIGGATALHIVTNPLSSACVTCHQGTLAQVHAGTAVGCACHSMLPSSEMNAAEAAGNNCVVCHAGKYAAHGFGFNDGASGPYPLPNNITVASGHNTTTYGTIGAFTKFDGTSGTPLLTWTASQTFTISTLKSQNALSVPLGTAFTAGQTGVVNSTWNFPTLSVFWPSVDTTGNVGQPAPAGAIKGLTANSVITCQDCHTGLNTGGPHGAAQNWGIDPAFPGDFSMAGLTKKVTAGVAMPSGAFSPSGIMVATNTTGTPLQNWQRTDKWANGTSGANAVICAKCHKLETALRGYIPANGETSRTVGTSGLLSITVEGANTAHDSHHQDNTDGSPQCVSCHVAIPHGWQAPRLLLDVENGTFAGTPYESANAIEAMGSIAALNNHLAVPSTGLLPYATGNGAPMDPAAGGSYNIAHVGTVLWDEGQCEACGDHYGNTVTSATPGQGAPYGNGNGVPVRIDETPLP